MRRVLLALSVGLISAFSPALVESETAIKSLVANSSPVIPDLHQCLMMLLSMVVATVRLALKRAI